MTAQAQKDADRAHTDDISEGKKEKQSWWGGRYMRPTLPLFSSLRGKGGTDKENRGQSEQKTPRYLVTTTLEYYTKGVKRTSRKKKKMQNKQQKRNVAKQHTAVGTCTSKAKT